VFVDRSRVIPYYGLMRQSQLFTKTRKEAPADEVSKNAQLLIRAGYIHKVMAGVYAYTPLGLRTLERIKGIVREEMNAIGGQEIIMTSLQPADVWKKTGRWDESVVDVWFKTQLQDGVEVGLAWSHEEAIMSMIEHHVSSYKDLPCSVYQFQMKLRNELRAKSGIMRGREFLMKDMYSMHATQEDMDQYYEKVIDAYKRIFKRVGLGDDTYITFASGGAFTKFSHEFQTICDAGEDVLYVHTDTHVAVNEEVLQDAVAEIGVSKDELTPVKSAEVGNIFKFGTEKGEKMNVTFKDADGVRKPVYLASYGIGINRVMGVVVEKFADEKGIVWPKEIAPFRVHLVQLGEDAEVVKKASYLYEALTGAGIEVLWDDRPLRPGEKFGDSDLLGIPNRVVVSKKTEDTYEVVDRAGGDVSQKTEKQLLELLAG
jgi:prolyl-tRNA synthetase